VSGTERVITVRDDDDVAVANLPDPIAGAVGPVDALDRPGLGPPEPVVIDLLEDRLVGHVVDVVLVGRPARPVAGRRQDLDDLQAIGRKVRGDDVVDLAGRVARPPNLGANVTWMNLNRGRGDAITSRSLSPCEGDPPLPVRQAQSQLATVGQPERGRQVSERPVAALELPAVRGPVDRHVQPIEDNQTRLDILPRGGDHQASATNEVRLEREMSPAGTAGIETNGSASIRSNVERIDR